jgi:hypothetical protein
VDTYSERAVSKQEERELNPEEMKRLKRLRRIVAFSQASAAPGVFTTSRFRPQEDL